MSKEKTKWFVEELLKGYPDPEDLVARGFSDEFILGISFIQDELLSMTMLALSRFLCHIQFFGNQTKAGVINLRRKLEGTKYQTISSLKDITDRSTSAQMTAKAYASNPDLYTMEKELALLEERAEYYNYMPERIQEYIQVLKYEMRRREARK